MLILKTLLACLAIGAALAVLQWCGMASHEHDHGTPGAEGHGCRFCPTAGQCLSAQPARQTCAIEEDRS